MSWLNAPYAGILVVAAALSASLAVLGWRRGEGLAGKVLDAATRTFSPGDVALLERFAPLAAAALDRARLLQDVKARWHEAETLRYAGAAVTETLGLDETLTRFLEQVEQVVPFDFECFFRGHLAESGHVPGAGLGLSIAQDVLQAHGGRVTAESQAGRGSTLTLWLRADRSTSVE
jgi:hypothetical protein